jgi:hypothetical protein
MIFVIVVLPFRARSWIARASTEVLEFRVLNVANFVHDIRFDRWLWSRQNVADLLNHSLILRPAVRGELDLDD